MQSGEDRLIARHFGPLATAKGALSLGDDAAFFAPPPGYELVLTTDAVVAGVHFLPDDPPETIGRKLLRVNLSDLAAKGAVPRGYLMTAAFPRGASETWISAFARGLKQDQAHFGISLLGGDTVSTPGPASFTATLIGEVAKTMLRRADARVGDLVCVSGTIGDGGFGLAELQSPQPGLTPQQRRFLIARSRLPQPRVRLGPLLHGIAHAALDVSDGLVQDLGHIARQSGVGIEIGLGSVPLSPAGRAVAAADAGARNRAITSGDDYEIAFTVPPGRLVAIETAARAARTRVTVIGHVVKGEGVAVRDAKGGKLAIGQGGFDHFAR